MQEMENLAKLVASLTVKYAEKLTEDRIRQEKIKAAMQSNALSTGSSETELPAESGGQDPIQATDGKEKTDSPDAEVTQAVASQPEAITAQAGIEVGRITLQARYISSPALSLSMNKFVVCILACINL